MKEALRQLCLEADFEIIAKPALLAEAGVTEPPGLMINGALLFQGHVPSLPEMKTIIAAIPKDGGLKGV